MQPRTEAAGWDRERILAVIWLVGSFLTVMTLVLPYDVEIDERARSGVAVLALVTGLVLLRVPRLPEWALHGVLAMGTLAIAVCCSLGVPDVEGVMFVLPVMYAFGTFPPQRAVGHLLLAATAFGVVLIRADMDHIVAPWVSWTLVVGVAGTLAFALWSLVELRERQRDLGRRDRRIAEVLQRTLLPQTLPVPAGTTLAADYVPAVREADVGGDFYDALELPGGRLVLAIGDVAGKGLPAAAVVGRVRTALGAYAVEDAEPASVLRRLDELLSTDSDLNAMTTLLYVLVDLPGGTLTWASAAHPPPLWLPRRGEPDFLRLTAGPPLGARARGLRPQAARPLEPGDGLLLYTDGLVERRGEMIDDGLARLRRAMAQAQGGAPARLAAALELLPDERADDVAVLAFELSPIADRLALDVPLRAEALAGMRAALRRWLSGRCPPAVADDVLLACSEAGANAVLHGGVPGGGGAFRVEATDDGDTLRVRIQDRGRWREPATPSDFGHGIEIMRALAESVDVIEGDDGTTIELEHRVAVRR